MNYDETWEAMSNLEDAFNRIMALETMLKDLKTAVDENNQEEIKDITDACVAFMPVYVQQYSKASMRAWNKTVRQIQRERNDRLDYEEIKKGLENDPYVPFHHPV